MRTDVDALVSGVHEAGEEDERLAWNSPVYIMPEDRARLVFAAMFPAPPKLTPAQRVERNVVILAGAIRAAEQSVEDEEAFDET